MTTESGQNSGNDNGLRGIIHESLKVGTEIIGTIITLKILEGLSTHENPNVRRGAKILR